MMKLKRLYEQAQDQGKAVEEVALERYGSMEEFQEAVEERRILDERDAKRKARRAGGSDTGYSSSSGMRTPDARGGTPARRFIFNNADESRPSSRQGFRRPGEERDGAHTPGGTGRLDALRREGGKPSGAFGTPAGATPIPSVFTPQALTRGPSGEEVARSDSDGRPIMTIEQLNRLQAKVLRAKLTDDADAEALEDQYELERSRYDASGEQSSAGALRTDEKGNTVEVAVLPTLDGSGKLYDVGLGKEDDDTRQGKRRKKEPKVGIAPWFR